METLNKIAGGMSVVKAYAGKDCKVTEGPTPADLMDPKFRAFLETVMRDALGESYDAVA